MPISVEIVARHGRAAALAAAARAAARRRGAAAAQAGREPGPAAAPTQGRTGARGRGEPEPEPPPATVTPPPPKKVEAPAPPPEPKKAEAPPPKAEQPKPAPEKPKPAPEKPKPVAESPSPSRKRRPRSPRSQPKPEKPKTPPAPKEEASDFDALLRSVEKTPKQVKAPEKREGKGTAAAAGGTGQPGTAKVAQINPSLLAASISRQITPCWNIPVAAQGIGGLRVELNIVMGPDGGIQSVVPVDAARMGRDPVFRAFAESAVRAVRACSPLKLPPESYQVWRNIIFNFDPQRMTG